MGTVPITDDQIAQLQAKVAKLIADKGTADAATATSNIAQSALTAAQTAAQDANVAEATADGAVSADVLDLETFVNGLVPAPTPPPPVAG